MLVKLDEKEFNNLIIATQKIGVVLDERGKDITVDFFRAFNPVRRLVCTIMNDQRERK